MSFKNREEAGRILADRIQKLRIPDPIVIALPRGGVPIAAEIARAIRAPLEVLVVRKLGAPGNPEFGIGAITEGDFYWVDNETVAALGVTHEQLNRVLLSESDEVRRRVQTYREDRPLPNLAGRSVILVDDGLATGVTAFTATRWLKDKGAERVLLAVPVCAVESSQALRGEVEVLCLETPKNFQAVSLWYDEFNQVGDEEVIRLLKKNETEETRMRPTPIHAPELGTSTEVILSDGSIRLKGTLSISPENKGIILFAHGSGSSRLSPRNQQVARALNEAGFSTLLFDLLTPGEANRQSAVFDIPLLAGRLTLAARWLQLDRRLRDLPLGYFGASTGAAAALVSAADLGRRVSAVVSRGGRPDLAIPQLGEVMAPTLLLVGGNDEPVIDMNEEALRYLAYGELHIIPGATHLFEEPGTLEEVSRQAIQWFNRHLIRERRKAA